MLIFVICVILIAIDQLTKWLAVTSLKPVGSISIIGDFFSLTYIENRGAAFGMLKGGKWFFLAITLFVVIIAVFYLVKNKPTKDKLWLTSAIVMIVSGAVGNAIDRLFRGYVVDFLDFLIFNYDFPVFNFADILVVLGTCLFAGGIILFDKEGKE